MIAKYSILLHLLQDKSVRHWFWSAVIKKTIKVIIKVSDVIVMSEKW